MSCPCQVAMETHLEVSKIDLYLLGIYCFPDAVTSIKQRERERERMHSPLPYVGTIGRVSFRNREVKTLEKLHGYDGVFLLIALWFVSDYKSNLYSQ